MESLKYEDLRQSWKILARAIERKLQSNPDNRELVELSLLARRLEAIDREPVVEYRIER